MSKIILTFILLLGCALLGAYSPNYWKENKIDTKTIKQHAITVLKCVILAVLACMLIVAIF